MKRIATLLLAAGAVLAFGAGGAKAQDEVVVAVVGPITGSNAVFGEQMKKGGQLAVDDINAKGGVLGKKLKLLFGDDACDPKQAVAVANQMVSQHVVFIDGHYCSSASIPASSVYSENSILQITPASTNPSLTDDAAKKGWINVFRTVGRDDVQGTVAGTYLAAHYKGKKVAVLDDKSQYGKGLADETLKAMNKHGMKPALHEQITQGDKDFSALITKMKQAGVVAVYFGGYQTEAGLMVRQMQEQGLKSQFISGDALVTDEFWKITGPAGEGTLMTFPPEPRDLPTAKAVVAEFKAQGYDPEGYTLYTYAAMQVFAQAAAQAKSVKMADLSKALHAHKYNTVVGPITFDKKGDILNPEYVFYVWHDGKYNQVKGKG